MGIPGVDKRYKIFWESTNYCRIELHYDSDMKRWKLNTTQTPVKLEEYLNVGVQTNKKKEKDT